MVFILSDRHDRSTDNVVKNFLRWDVPFFRLHEDNSITSIDIEIGNNQTVLHFSNGSSIDLNTVTSYWYRRGKLTFLYKELIKESNTLNQNISQIESHLLYEQKKILEYIYYILEKKRRINRYQDIFVNKLHVLHLAQELGLKIPTTYISNNLGKFVNQDNGYITKPIGDGLYFAFANTAIMSYTEEVSLSDTLEYTSYASLLQEKINKRYEVRSFFLNGDFYSMAIFSQCDVKTQIDFRKYNFDNPNRNTPYILPSTIKEKLSQLMILLGFNSGSIDLIRSEAGEYYFLEVNPVGQFGMISYPCGYNLEEKIAKYLAYG